MAEDETKTPAPYLDLKKFKINPSDITIKFTDPGEPQTYKWLDKYALADSEATKNLYCDTYYSTEYVITSNDDITWTAPSPSFYQDFKPGQTFVPCGDATCMLCAATGQYAGSPQFFSNEEALPAQPLVSSIPALAEPSFCPVENCYDILAGAAFKVKRPIWQTVIHLNDHEQWTREQIADWLETLDADLQFKLPESPEITEGEGV